MDGAVGLPGPWTSAAYLTNSRADLGRMRSQSTQRRETRERGNAQRRNLCRHATRSSTVTPTGGSVGLRSVSILNRRMCCSSSFEPTGIQEQTSAGQSRPLADEHERDSIALQYSVLSTVNSKQSTSYVVLSHQSLGGRFTLCVRP